MADLDRIVVKIQADVSAFRAGMKEAESSLGSFASKSKEAGDKVAQTSKGMQSTQTATGAYARSLEQAYGFNDKLTNSQAGVIRGLERQVAATQMTSREFAAYHALQRARTTADTEAGRTITGLALAHHDLAQKQSAAVVGMSAGAAAAGRYAAGAGLARHELVNLSRQVQDVGVSLASGQSPMMVLVQQGTQIADIFGSSQVTVRSFFTQMAEGAARIFTPMRVAVGATLGLGAAAVTVTSLFQSSQRDIERGLMGIAGASRATVGDINQIADSTRSALGFSAGEARDAAMAFAGTGRIMVDNIGPLVTMADQLSRALGISASDAAERLAKSFADPAKGAIELNKEFGVLDRRTLDYIRTLDALGNRTRAQAVLMDELGPAIARQAEKISVAEKAWRGFVNLLKEGFVEIPAQAISGLFNINPSTTKQLADAEADLRRFQELMLRWPENTAILPQMQQIADRVQALREKLKADEAINFSKQLNAVADSAAATAAAFIPEIAAVEKAGLAFNNLFLISQRPDLAIVLDKAGLTAQQFATALERAGMAYSTMLTPAQQLTAQHDVAMAASTAQTFEERMRVVEMQTQLQLAGQKLTVEERALAISRARELAETAVTTQARNRLSGLRDQQAVAGAVTGQERIAAQEAATYNRLIREGVPANQARKAAAQEAAIAEAQASASVRQQAESLDDQTRLIYARLRGQEASVAAEIAYERAIRSGADAGAAAAARTAVLANERAKATEKAASAAQREAEAIERAAAAAAKFAYETAYLPKGFNYQVGQDVWMGKDGRYSQFNPEGYKSSDPRYSYFAEQAQMGNMRFDPSMVMDAAQAIPFGAWQKTAQGYENLDINPLLERGGGLNEAIDKLFPRSRNGDFGNDQIGLINRLIELQPEETQITSIERVIRQLREQPVTLAREELIASLSDKLEQLRESTDALNDTIGLDPLYTQGHGYVGIGYYPDGGRSPQIPIDPNTPPFAPGLEPQRMATGGAFRVGGAGGVDSKYLPILATPGELFEVTPPHEISRTNHGGAGPGAAMVNNITNNFHFPPDRSYGARRTRRQMREGYGRSTATMQ